MANLSDPQAIKEKEKTDSHERDIELADVKSVLSTPEGRRFVWRYLKYCDRISFSRDALVMAFNDGERNISLQMKAEVIKADDRLYLLMESEAIKGGS
jgi:hypothetical protein